MSFRLNKESFCLVAVTVLFGAVLAACDTGGSNAANASLTPSASSSPSASMPSASAPAETAPASPPASSSAPEDPDASLLPAFQSLIESGASAAQLNDRLDSDLPKAEPETADEMLRALIAYYDAHVQELQLPLEQKDVEQILGLWPFTEDEIPQIKSESARKAVQEAVDGGYKLETAEGMIFPVVDYAKLKRFDDAVSPEMRDYIALLATESDRKSASDGSLVISWDEVTNRALAAEKFIRDYPEAKELAAAGDLYLRYMTDLLVGLPNTPIFDFDTYKLRSDVKAVYKNIAAGHADTTTGRLVQQFLDVMAKTNDAVFTKGKDGQADVPEVKAFRDGMESQIRKELGIAKTDK